MPPFSSSSVLSVEPATQLVDGAALLRELEALERRKALHVLPPPPPVEVEDSDILEAVPTSPEAPSKARKAPRGKRAARPVWQQEKAWRGAWTDDKGRQHPNKLLSDFVKGEPMPTFPKSLQRLLSMPEWKGSTVDTNAEGMIVLTHPSGATMRLRADAFGQ